MKMGWSIIDYAEAVILIALENEHMNGAENFIIKEGTGFGNLIRNIPDAFTLEKEQLFSADELDLGLREIAQTKALQIVKTPHATDRYIVDLKVASDICNESAHEEGTVLNMISTLGEDWLWESVQNCRGQEEKSGDDQEKTPASDRLVFLNHNSKSYEEAVEVLDELYEGIRSKNDLFITDEEKEICLVAVKTSKIILSQDKVEESIFHEVILPKLKWVGEKCANVAISQLVTEAIKALLKLL